MAQAIDTTNYVYLAMTANGWGQSPKSEADAIKACREYMGSSHVAKYGYVTFRVHPDFSICQVHGNIFTPTDHPVIKLTDKIKRKKAA
jgi:hypothetical protein